MTTENRRAPDVIAGPPSSQHAPFHDAEVAQFFSLVATADPAHVQAVLGTLGPEAAQALMAAHHQGTSVLHVAAWRGSFELVDVLCRAGADLNARDGEGHSVLQAAMARLDSALRQQSLGPRSTQLTENSDAARHFVRLLVRAGADPLAGAPLHATPPWHACYLQEAALLGEFLAASGARATRFLQATRPDIPGQTLLHEAVTIRASSCGALLAKAGANLDARDGANRTPLDLALQTNAVEMVLVLAPGRLKVPSVQASSPSPRVLHSFHSAAPAGLPRPLARSIAVDFNAGP